jgi:hypothetical protein
MSWTAAVGSRALLQELARTERAAMSNVVPPFYPDDHHTQQLEERHLSHRSRKRG